MLTLTNKQILEAFPEECKTLIPREIRRLKQIVKEYKRNVRLIELRHYPDRFLEHFALSCLEVFAPKQELQQLKRLEELQEFILNPPKQDDTRITPEQIQRAKGVLISSLYSFQKIKRNGQRIIALCPFHTEESGSFVIYPNNSAHCFGCQLSFQDSIAFVQKLQGYSFPQAVRALAS